MRRTGWKNYSPVIIILFILLLLIINKSIFAHILKTDNWIQIVLKQSQ